MTGVWRVSRRGRFPDRRRVRVRVDARSSGDIEAHGKEVAFVAAAAHELRTPLTAIRGLAGMLREHRDVMSPDDVDAAFEALDRHANGLAKLATELLDLGLWQRGHVPEAGPVAVDAAVADALELAPPPEHVRVSVVTNGADPAALTALADRSSVARAVVNLLTNAYRYGGDAVVVTIADTPEHVHVGVEDNGPGVDDDVITNLFQPFTRGARGVRQAGSAGLGLALTREIAEAYGGAVRHDAAQPTGARFTIMLPRTGLDDAQH